MSTPSSTIYICSNVPLNNRYDHTLYFGHYTARDSYFAGKVVKTLSAYTYLRKKWKLKVEATMLEARYWSYLYFRNGATNASTHSRVYFYFITNVEYVNDSTVELSLELDVMQTYMTEWILRPCYVEREHSKTDEWGDNTLDEGLDVGDYLITTTERTELYANIGVMVASTIHLNSVAQTMGDPENVVITPYYGDLHDYIYGGFDITCVPIFNEYGDKPYLAGLNQVLATLDEKGQAESVFTMWEYPLDLVDYEHTADGTLLGIVKGSKDKTYTATGRPHKIDGYTPKNKKVLQYPYCFMYVSNNAGGAAVYQYEKFDISSNGVRQFRIQGNISPDATVKLIPLKYKGSDVNRDESLSMSGYPLCAWNTDPYKMWLAQNQNQQNLGMGLSGLKIIGGAAAIAGGLVASAGTGGAGAAAGFAGISAGIGMISSGATEIASQLAQRADKDIQPPQSKGSISGSHNLARGCQDFFIYHKTIDAYHAEMIDNYFSMYGYATRKVKTPNINARPAWTYVKTIGSNVGGNIPHEDLQLINAIFDKGITFWKNTDVGNYNLANEV